MARNGLGDSKVKLVIRSGFIGTAICAFYLMLTTIHSQSADDRAPKWFYEGTTEIPTYSQLFFNRGACVTYVDPEWSSSDSLFSATAVRDLAHVTVSLIIGALLNDKSKERIAVELAFPNDQHSIFIAEHHNITFAILSPNQFLKDQAPWNGRVVEYHIWHQGIGVAEYWFDLDGFRKSVYSLPPNC